MEINVVWHFAIGVIVQVEFHQIPLPYPYKFAWHFAPKRPERILHPLGQALDHLTHFEVDNDLGGIVAGNRRWHQGGICEYRCLLTYDLRSPRGCTTRLVCSIASEQCHQQC